jgi:ABC-type multidrug transport system fused ATPase/permease subunit
MTYSIIAEGLTKRFADTVALDRIDLAVRTGSVFGLLGPNGAGKTTTVRILATLVRPDGGHAAVCGLDHGTVIATGTPEELKARTGALTLSVRPARAADVPAVVAVVAGFTRADPEIRNTIVTVPVGQEDVMPAVVRRLEDDGIRVAELSLRGSSLDEVFLTLTGHRTKDEGERGRMTTYAETTVTDSTVSDYSGRALSARVGPVEGLRQTFSLAWRTLVQIRHNPVELIDFSIQPVMFVLLFTYVFGGAIGGSPKAYLMFALPGIIVQNSLFTTLNTATGLSTDLKEGFFDRLRSLPIARFAPLSGRIVADLAKQAWALVTLLAIGAILGFRFGTGAGRPLGVLAGFGLVLACTLAISWALVLVSMLVHRGVRAAGGAGLQAPGMSGGTNPPRPPSRPRW